MAEKTNRKDRPLDAFKHVMMPDGAATPGGLPRLRLIAAVLTVSVLAALLAPRFQFSTIVALIFVVFAVYASYRAPRVATFVFIIYTSTIISPEYFGYFVDINLIYWGAELFLLVIVIGAIVQRVREGAGAFNDFTLSPVALSLLLLGAVISAKSFVFLVETRFPQWAFSHVYTFNRSLGFFALFIPVYLLFNTEKRQRLFLTVVMVLGGIIAFRVILEVLFPQLWIFDWIGFRETLASEFPSVDVDILRLRAPGGSLVQVCFWMGLMNMVLRPLEFKRLALYLPLTMLMLTGILLEFNRSYVVPMIGLMGVAMLLNRPAVRAKITLLLLVATFAVVGLSMVTGVIGEYLAAFSERYTSAFAQETFKTQSLSSRKIENTYAWESISEEPVFGIGIDEYYRPPIPGMLDNLRWYIHNGYIWYWVYFGFIGLAALVAAVVAAVYRGFTGWQKVQDPFLQSGVLALTFTMLTLAIANFYAPRFYEYGTVPVIALIVGMIEAIVVRSRKGREAAGGETDLERLEP
ncbi:MAG: O-antigen ligase family protein [Thermoleophilia bacterium]